LRKEEIIKLKEWLDLEDNIKDMKCPFNSNCDICLKMFPDLINRRKPRLGYNCPCELYPFKYVKKIAKKIYEKEF